MQTSKYHSGITKHLTESTCLLALGHVHPALLAANAALSKAQKQHIYYLECKSQLHRGRCLMKLEQWNEARAAFVQAANVRCWAWGIEGLMRICESGREREAWVRRGGMTEEEWEGLDGCWAGWRLPPKF